MGRVKEWYMQHQEALDYIEELGHDEGLDAWFSMINHELFTLPEEVEDSIVELETMVWEQD